MFLYFLSVLLFTRGGWVGIHQMQGGLELPKQLQSMKENQACCLHTVGTAKQAKPNGLWATHQFQQARFTSLNPPKLSMLPEHVQHGSTAHRTSGATECNVS